MRKGKELTNEERQMVVDLHKSGNGYKTIAKKLNIPLTTIRAIIKKFKTTETVVNLPGRGKCILPPRTVRQMVREAKGNPRATVGELQNLVASCSHQVSKSIIRCHLHANRLFGRVARKKQPTNVSAWSLLNGIGTSIGTGCYGQMRRK